MQLSFAVLVASLVAVSHAWVDGISVPDAIKPGESFDVVIKGSNRASRAKNVAIAFGYGKDGVCSDCLQHTIGAHYLAKGQMSQLAEFNKTLTIPKDAPKGDAVVTASLMMLTGTSGTPVLKHWQAKTKFDDYTSKTYTK